MTTTWSPCTSALVTLVSTRISRPCFFSILPASFEMSLSAAAKKLGSASYTTTSAPRRRHTEPSSRPITPAPITPRRLGTAVKSSAPVESTIRSPSVLATGISIGTEPAARITFLAVIVVSLSSSRAVNLTFLSAPLPSTKVPQPCSQSTPLPFSNAATPPVNCLTIPSLRSIIFSILIATSPVLIPCSSRSCLVAS